MEIERPKALTTKPAEFLDFGCPVAVVLYLRVKKDIAVVFLIM